MGKANLYTYRAEGLSLDTAAASLARALGTADGGAKQGVALTALLYSPQQCMFAVYSGEVWQGPNGPLDVAGVFEARVFSHSAELRWLKDPVDEAGHRCAIVSERELGTLDHGQGWQASTQEVMRGPELRYLLWGEGTGKYASQGWSRLGTARVGVLHVPLAAVAEGARAALVAQEYLGEREHGNVVVIDERLVKLETYGGAA
jgi:CRISPR-associated protein (TIGR03984 family)